MPEVPEDSRRSDRASGRELPVSGSRGKVTTRPSRDSILQAYAAEDAQRAQNARVRSQNASAEYLQNTSRAATRAAQRAELLARQQDQRAFERKLEQDEVLSRQRIAQQQARAQLAERRERAAAPLSSQESQERTRTWQENYEYQRATRDPLMRAQYGRGGDREVIDGRGSIDSRAFNEHQILVGYTIDERDRHQPDLDSVDSNLRWHSRAGQGFENAPEGSKRRFSGAPTTRGGKPTVVNRDLVRKKGLPFAAKLLIGAAVLAVAVALVLVFALPDR